MEFYWSSKQERSVAKLSQTPAPVVLFSTLFLLLASGLQFAQAEEQTQTEASIHWAYSSFLGTGWYKLSGNRQVYVLRMNPKWYFREASIDASGDRKFGIDFHFPVTMGLHKLEQLEDFVDPENIGTVAFNPGVELEFPVSDRWRLRTYAHLGWGTDTDGDESAWTYDAGIKSRYAFNKGKLDWGLVNELFTAGYKPDEGTNGSLGGFMAGLDFSYPIRSEFGMGHPLRLTWDVSYRWFLDDLTFRDGDGTSSSFDDEWEIGIALARRDGPIPIWFMNYQQLGLTYRFNSDGSFNAITVNFRSPFTR